MARAQRSRTQPPAAKASDDDTLLDLLGSSSEESEDGREEAWEPAARAARSSSSHRRIANKDDSIDDTSDDSEAQSPSSRRRGRSAPPARIRASQSTQGRRRNARGSTRRVAFDVPSSAHRVTRVGALGGGTRGPGSVAATDTGNEPESSEESFIPNIPVRFNNEDETDGFDLSGEDDHHHWRDAEFDYNTGEFKVVDPGIPDDIPTVDKWRLVPPTSMREVEISINGARSTLYRQAVAEIADFEKTAARLGLDLSPTGFVEYIYGRNSKLAQTLMESLDIEYSDLCQFLATFYSAAEFGTTAKRLEDHERYDYSNLMPSEEYTQIWNQIASCGKDGKQLLLWRQLEDVLNELCWKFFLSGDLKSFIIALDDDKIHFQYSTQKMLKDVQYLCGAKAQQHVRDNRKGMTMDTAAEPATGFLLNASILRHGETNTQNYDRMMRKMFRTRFLIAGAPLVGVMFCSDRGYWKPELISLLLGLGAIVFGTVMRSYWVPYTFDQKLSKGDKRVKIDKKKGKSLFQAFVRWGNSMLKTVLYRSGTGAMSLAMTSDTDDRQKERFDFCFKNGADDRWYHSNISPGDRHLKAFATFFEGQAEFCSDIKHHLNLLRSVITMMTCTDLCQVWFALRMLSFTSSSSEAAIKAVAPHLPPDGQDRESFEIVMEFAGLERYLSTSTAASSLDEPRGEDTDISDGSDEDKIGPSWVRSIISRTANNPKSMAEDIRDALTEGTIEHSDMVAMLCELGVRRDRIDKSFNEQKIIKTLQKWAKSVVDYERQKLDYERRIALVEEHSDSGDSTELPAEAPTPLHPYEFINSAAELEELLLRRVGKKCIDNMSVPGPHRHPTKKPERVAALLYLDAHPDEVPENVAAIDDDDESSRMRNAILAGALCRAFLTSEQTDAKAERRLGHQNEPTYLRQYLEDSKKGRTADVKLVNVARCGMAQQNDRVYVRDSADAIAFEKCDILDSSYSEQDGFDSIKSHLVECKCRAGSANRSYDKARRIRDEVARRLGHAAMTDAALGEAVYMKLSTATDAALVKKLIPSESELIQMLHHAFTYDRDTTTLLVGDRNGNVLYGLIVTFHDGLLQAYGRVMDFMYEHGLSVFYSPDLDDLPMEEIETILRTTDKLKSRITMDDFMTSYLIWRQLCIEVDPSIVKFPIPSCDMLLPFIHAFWNSAKGGSDTITKLIWNCVPKLPTHTPQTVIVARFLMLFAVVTHRPLQMTSYTKKPKDCDSLLQIRDNANQRRAFNNTCNDISKILARNSKRPDTASSEADGAAESQAFAQADAPRLTNRNLNTRSSVNEAIEGGCTGATPGRGRSTVAARHHANFAAYQERASNCTGGIAYCFLGDEVGVIADGKGNPKPRRRTCDLCGSSSVPWYCTKCKRVLCLDKDRQGKIQEIYNDESHEKNAEVRRMFPGGVPEAITRSGKKTLENGKVDYSYIRTSCYYYTHKHLYVQCNACADDHSDGEDDGTDHQLAAVATSIVNSSPQQS